MKLEDLNLQSLLAGINEAVSDEVFRGINWAAPARDVMARGELHGLIMGRITAMLMATDDELEPLNPKLGVAVLSIQAEIAEKLREQIRPAVVK